jgi:hypothetical protein
MEDFIDEFFSTVDEFYPGSKRKRKETKKEVYSPEIKTWDARPFVKPYLMEKTLRCLLLAH